MMDDESGLPWLAHARGNGDRADSVANIVIHCIGFHKCEKMQVSDRYLTHAHTEEQQTEECYDS